MARAVAAVRSWMNSFQTVTRRGLGVIGCPPSSVGRTGRVGQKAIRTGPDRPRRADYSACPESLSRTGDLAAEAGSCYDLRAACLSPATLAGGPYPLITILLSGAVLLRGSNKDNETQRT